MYLAGRIKFDEEDYFLCWKDIKSAECFWVFSPYHKDDALNVAMGNPATQEVISSEFRLASFYTLLCLQKVISSQTKIHNRIWYLKWLDLLVLISRRRIVTCCLNTYRLIAIIEVSMLREQILRFS